MNRSGAVLESVSPAELYNVITAAASQDFVQVQASTSRLKEMLDLSGAYDALHEIAAEKSIPLQVRQQSIIQFKNVALTHWRSRKLLTDEQRARIRARSLTFVDEEDILIAECNEVIIAKIARNDFPSNWPSLINDLMGVIESNFQIRNNASDMNGRATLILRRSLKILNEFLKEFSGVKMPNGIKTMGQIVEQLHLVLFSYYSKLSTSLGSLDPSTLSSPQTADNILLAHLVYKCLVKLSIWLWHRLTVGKDDLKNLHPWFREIFQNSATQVKMLIELRINLVIALRSLPTVDAITRRSIDQLTRHVRLFGKFFRRLQQLSVVRFVTLPTCSDLVLYYWSKIVQAASTPDLIADSNEAVFPIRFLVQAMVLFKENLAQWAPQRRNGTPNENSLSQEFVENAVLLLVTQFIPLKPSDLEGWMSDPEEWVNLEDRENELWEFELRPCSERVLVTLSTQCKDYVTPLLESTFKQAIDQPTSDLPSIIQKEAIYCAIGRCAPRLKEVIPFQQWLSHTLSAEARETNPSYPIIKRRIAWLIGKWISDMCSPANIPIIWEVLVHLLSDRGPGTDAVVRLTAAVALKECVDTLEFDLEVFAPFLPAIVVELMRLIEEADIPESRRRIASTLNTIIERSDIRIVSLVDRIVKPLPQLWTAAGEDWLFKASLLRLISKLIGSIKERSTLMAAIVVPLVRESLSPGSISTLDEDGLVLWLTALRNTNTVEAVNGAPALLDLFPFALTLLSTNLDLLGKIVNIVESYFVLNGSCVLQGYAVSLFSAFLVALKSSPTTTNTKHMIISLNLLVQTTPSSLWGEAMHVSGLFSYLLETLLENEAATIILTEIIYILARIAMADRRMFLQLISATASSQNKPESPLYEGLLDQWWCKFDTMSEPRHRKLTAMGIASLVSTGRTEVLQRLPTEIFNLWMDVFGEIKEAQNCTAADQDGLSLDPSQNIKRYWEQDEPPHSYFQNSQDTPEYDRRKAIFNNDVVRTTALSSFIASSIREAEIACGGAQAFHNLYLAKSDPLVLKGIQAELVNS